MQVINSTSFYPYIYFIDVTFAAYKRENLARLTTLGAFHLVTQVDTNIILSFLTFNKKQSRTILVSTCVTKWKAPIGLSFLLTLVHFTLSVRSVKEQEEHSYA